MWEMAKILSLFAVILLVTACGQLDPNDQIDEGEIVENVYRSEEIGWTMEIPNGWKLLTREQVDGYENKGKEMLLDAFSEDFDFDGLKNLLHFQKNQFNVFQSTSEPFLEEYEGEWSENNRALKDVLLETYRSQGIQVESSEIEIEEIDGVKFEVYNIVLKAPNGKVVVTQTMYSSLINGYDFGANMTYNSDGARDVMLGVWKKSKFVRTHNKSVQTIP